jgi:hypothetical protein
LEESPLDVLEVDAFNVGISNSFFLRSISFLVPDKNQRIERAGKLPARCCDFAMSGR